MTNTRKLKDGDRVRITNKAYAEFCRTPGTLRIMDLNGEECWAVEFNQCRVGVGEDDVKLVATRAAKPSEPR